MASLITALTSPAGRLRRRAWWALEIAITLANVVLVRVVALLLGSVGDVAVYQWMPVIQLICGLPFLWPEFVIGVKRLHDLGRSAVWITPFYVYYFADTASRIYDAVTGTFGGYHRLSDASWDVQFIVYGRWIYFVALVVVFGLLAGQKRVNRFGPVGGRPAAEPDVFD